MDKATLLRRIGEQKIETPSWGYNDSGTRFGVFPQAGAAKTLAEKLEDAGMVHKLTGVCPTVALHIPWDTCENWNDAKGMAAQNGVQIGAINPNVFQDADYQFGSICNRDETIRKKAVKAHLDCIDIAKACGSEILSIWLADGTNYPGQDDMRGRKRRMEASFKEVYAALPDDMRMVIEYKFFEPAFYHTDLQDWGSSLLQCTKLGPKAQVLVDTGHHAQGTNIEHIVAILLDEGKLGGFHFNSRKYADDDLGVGALNQYELFLIYNELIAAEDDKDQKVAAAAKKVAYMFDQCNTHKPSIENILQSVLRVQEVYSKALLIDRPALEKARADRDIVACEEILQDAYQTDTRPMLREWRESKGMDPEPLQAFRRSGYLAAKGKERQERRKGTGLAIAASGTGFPR
jgi:L-rhamnose isomerase / sugar isomerase